MECRPVLFLDCYNEAAIKAETNPTSGAAARSIKHRQTRGALRMIPVGRLGSVRPAAAAARNLP